MLVRTSDHGDLLGAHGGLHQKWFNLYDEATRCRSWSPASAAGRSTPATVRVPTRTSTWSPRCSPAAGIDEAAVAAELAADFTEVHPLPGRDLMPVVADPGSAPETARST